jgi:hypothetical protein
MTASSEMEHNPLEMGALGDFLQYLLNRKQINAETWLRR